MRTGIAQQLAQPFKALVQGGMDSLSTVWLILRWCLNAT